MTHAESDIREVGDPILRSQAAELTPDEIRSKAVKKTIHRMLATMRRLHGVGIAAPQIGVSQQIILVESSKDNPRYPGQPEVPLTLLFNPKITCHSNQIREEWEGCLSVPRLRARVQRWESLTVQASAENGSDVIQQADGWFARILQHEIDHLYGKLYLDRVINTWTFTTAENLLLHPPNLDG